jgi:hypothetical protein
MKRRVRHYRQSAPQALSSDQRKRLERDLAGELRRAAAERASAHNFRATDHDEDSAQAADARALDAEQQAESIRTVLARFTAAPSFPRPRSFRR